MTAAPRSRLAGPRCGAYRRAVTDPRSPGAGGDGGGSAAGGSGADEVVDSGDGMRMTLHPRPGGVLVVTVEGELDLLTAPALRDEVTRRIPSVSLVVLALDGVGFLGTSGLAALIEIRESAHRAGVELRLAARGQRVLRPLGIAGLHHLYDIHDDVEAALSS